MVFKPGEEDRLTWGCFWRWNLRGDIARERRVYRRQVKGNSYMGTHYTPEQRTALVEKVRGLVANGMSQTKACAEAGIAEGSFYNWTAAKKQRRKPTVAMKAKPKAAPATVQKPKVLEITIPEEDRVVIFFAAGKPSDVNATMDRFSMAALRGDR
jgi:transposase